MKIPDRIPYSALNFPICNFIGFEKANHLIIPEYQRGYVWLPSQEELLIDSIFKSLPIGNIFLNQRGSTSDYEIVDGQQRLTTIFKFLRDGFTYQGVYYSELSKENRARIEHFVVQTYITNYDNVKDIIRLYHRLNWAGTQHTVEEMVEIDKQMKESEIDG